MGETDYIGLPFTRVTCILLDKAAAGFRFATDCSEVHEHQDGFQYKPSFHHRTFTP